MSSLMASLGIDRMSEDDRIRLVEEIIDSFDDEREVPPLSDELKQELDRRIALLDADPSRARPWQEVVARIRARLHK